MSARQRGSASLLLVAILAVAAAAGAWNYRRNLAAEPPRPFAHHGDAELAQLTDAYRQDVAQWQQRGDALRADRASGARGALLGEQVRAFEQAQRAGDRQRAAATELAGREATLRELEQEQQLRAAPGGELGVHLRRLLTI